MRIIAISTLALAVTLGACGESSDTERTAPAAPVEKGLPLRMIDGKPDPNGEVARMHVVAGRWQSEPGAIKGGPRQVVSMDVSNDRKFSLQVRSPAPGGQGDAVDVDIRGAFTWTPTGVLVAKGDAASARPPLKGFAEFRGTFPQEGGMTITGAAGESYTLAYKGL